MPRLGEDIDLALRRAEDEVRTAINDLDDVRKAVQSDEVKRVVAQAYDLVNRIVDLRDHLDNPSSQL